MVILILEYLRTVHRQVYFVLISIVMCVSLIIYEPSVAQENMPTLELDVTEGVIEPISIALPSFVLENGTSNYIANEVLSVISKDLTNTGFFRVIPDKAYISEITNIDAPVRFADWKAINASVMLVGAVSASGGKVAIKFRLWDVLAQRPIVKGIKYEGPIGSVRRMSHKVADLVYKGVTGEGPYFDSRIVFVSEAGSKGNRTKRLAIMDQDGQNIQYLTDSNSIVLAPRFSPDSEKILYTSYESGKPRVYLMNLRTRKIRSFQNLPGMTFAPRFSPDGKNVVLSITENGNTDIFIINLLSNNKFKLTKDSAIDTAPSFSPDGDSVVFESDRGGSQQIYVIAASGGKAKRISFGNGRYGTPVWSPRGDMVAFTKMNKGKFHIGVMRIDGSQERILTTSFLDEGPAWSPNGRVIIFFRETPGPKGSPSLYTVDVTGRNMRKLDIGTFASDPAWSSLLK